MVGALHATKAKKIPTPPGWVPAENTVQPSWASVSAYSIADLIKDVKDEFGDTFSKGAYRKSGLRRDENDFTKSLMFSDRTPTPSLRQTLTAMEVTPDMNETERYLPPASDANAVFVDRQFVRQDSRRRDYQYTVDGARDFFSNPEVYHDFAGAASDAIARSPCKKQHFISVIHYADDVFMCVVNKDGPRKYHLEDVAFIDVSGYNGRISEITTRFERMYAEYGKERLAGCLGNVITDVRFRFCPIDSGRNIRPIQTSEKRSGKKSDFSSTGRTAGEWDQRSGFSERNGEVTEYSDRTPTPSLRQTLTAMEVTPDMNKTLHCPPEVYVRLHGIIACPL